LSHEKLHAQRMGVTWKMHAELMVGSWSCTPTDCTHFFFTIDNTSVPVGAPCRQGPSYSHFPGSLLSSWKYAICHFVEYHCAVRHCIIYRSKNSYSMDSPDSVNFLRQWDDQEKWVPQLHMISLLCSTNILQGPA
jgi:hypothetical protein